MDKWVNIGKKNVVACFELLFNRILSNVDDKECLNVDRVYSKKLFTSSSYQTEWGEFFDSVSVNPQLKSDDLETLQNLLCSNKSVFVTKDNPDISVTMVMQRTIYLKPNAVSKHHKPILPPQKREALRHQIDEVLLLS